MCADLWGMVLQAVEKRSRKITGRIRVHPLAALEKYETRLPCRQLNGKEDLPGSALMNFPEI